MRLAALLREAGIEARGVDPALAVTEVTADSRACAPGSLFVAVPGSRCDGHDFLAQARAAGAVAVVVENTPPELDIPVIRVDDSRAALAALAAARHGHPARDMTMIAVTGTNGKTTCTHVLAGIIDAAGGRPGVMGTIGYRLGGREFGRGLTTPGPLELHGVLAEMRTAGATHVLMEASSHALAQGRLAGVVFAGGYFANLSRDHLDYHGGMEGYFAAKKRLFTHYLAPGAPAVIWLRPDDEWGARLARELAPGSLKIVTCGPPESGADWRAEVLSRSRDGQHIRLTGPEAALEFDSPLHGDFNTENVCGMAVLAVSLGVEPAVIEAGIAAVAAVPGRMERIEAAAVSKSPAVFVDFAHTPDALARVLKAARPLAPGRLIVVFGCGGDRDPGKRAPMGEAAGGLSDVAVLTADNSRSEDPAAIIGAIERGVRAAGMAPLETSGGQGYVIEEDRAAAIARAVELATAGDVVVICGKGHETTQTGPAGSRFFDDRQEARRALEQRTTARKRQ